MKMSETYPWYPKNFVEELLKMAEDDSIKELLETHFSDTSEALQKLSEFGIDVNQFADKDNAYVNLAYKNSYIYHNNYIDGNAYLLLQIINGHIYDDKFCKEYLDSYRLKSQIAEMCTNAIEAGYGVPRPINICETISKVLSYEPTSELVDIFLREPRLLSMTKEIFIVMMDEVDGDDLIKLFNIAAKLPCYNNDNDNIKEFVRLAKLSEVKYSIDFTADQLRCILGHNLLDIDKLFPYIINNPDMIVNMNCIINLDPTIQYKPVADHIKKENLIYIPHLDSCMMNIEGILYNKSFIDILNLSVYNSKNGDFYTKSGLPIDEYINRFVNIGFTDDINEVNSDLITMHMLANSCHDAMNK